MNPFRLPEPPGPLQMQMFLMILMSSALVTFMGPWYGAWMFLGLVGAGLLLTPRE